MKKVVWTVVIAAVVVGVSLEGMAIHSENTFEDVYRVNPSTDTDGQRAAVQADVTRTILAYTADDEDLRNSKCDSTVIEQVQSCTQEKLEQLKVADETLDIAVSIAEHFGYDTAYKPEDMTAFRTARESAKTSHP
jgi:hypothetical protein